MENPKETSAFALVGLICGRFRDVPDDRMIAAVATNDGGVARLTYGDVRTLLSAAFEAGDRLQRISSWHARESGPSGTVGDFCVECGTRWPCDTRRMTDGIYEDDDAPRRTENMPNGLCDDRNDHKPHVRTSDTLGTFWCIADQTTRLPYAAEARRKAK